MTRFFFEEKARGEPTHPLDHVINGRSSPIDGAWNFLLAFNLVTQLSRQESCLPVTKVSFQVYGMRQKNME